MAGWQGITEFAEPNDDDNGNDYDEICWGVWWWWKHYTPFSCFSCFFAAALCEKKNGKDQ